MDLEIDRYNTDFHFSSLIYRHSRPDFLLTVKPVFDEYVESALKNTTTENVYPGIMTNIISQDDRVEEFVKYVSGISWDILNSQGYNMDLFYTDASEMWGQYHPHSSSMDNHIHGYGCQLIGFYFLDTPKDSSEMLVHDPRSAKVYADLPMREGTELQHGHSSVWYKPEAGDIMFTNAWLAHSFTRNKSQQPFNFIHINVRVVGREQNFDNVSVDSPIVI